MNLSEGMRLALRFGAAVLAVAAVVLVVVAATVPSRSRDAAPKPVSDPTAIALPKPGLFGGSVTVYGRAERAGVPPSELGCRLLSRTGREQSSAKMSDLRVVSAEPVTVDGQQLQPLFSIGSYSSGTTLACTDATVAEPLALGSPSTFAERGGLVRAAAAAGAAVCAVLAVLGFVFTRRRSWPSA